VGPDLSSEFGMAFEECMVKAETIGVSCARSLATVPVSSGYLGFINGLGFSSGHNSPPNDVITFVLTSENVVGELLVFLSQSSENIRAFLI
jgi:hypothetical protein